MSRALLIIDMQVFIEERIQAGVAFFPPNAIDNMVYVLHKFRENNAHVVHVMHETVEKGSFLHKEATSYPIISKFQSQAREPVFIKNTSSAFVSTDLADHLKQIQADEIIVIGGVTGFCVNSTIRHGADLGFNMCVVKDATISFDLATDGLDAKIIHNTTISLLDADFAKVLSMQEV